MSSVVIVTDGKDEDVGSIGLPTWSSPCARRSIRPAGQGHRHRASGPTPISTPSSDRGGHRWGGVLRRQPDGPADASCSTRCAAGAALDERQALRTAGATRRLPTTDTSAPDRAHERDARRRSGPRDRPCRAEPTGRLRRREREPDAGGHLASGHRRGRRWPDGPSVPAGQRIRVLHRTVGPGGGRGEDGAGAAQVHRHPLAGLETRCRRACRPRRRRPR